MGNSGSSQLYPVLREYSQQRIWEIWRAGKQGEVLTAEDARLYEVLEHHLQYAGLWDRLCDAGETEIIRDGVNLVLHVLFHHAVENQLDAGTPPAVRQVMRALMQKGLKEHDAAHSIASVLAWELYDMMQKNRPYDETRYVRELRKLPLKVKPTTRKKKDRG